MPPIDAEVTLHGQHIGWLRYVQGGSTFTYEQQLTGGHDVFGQAFEDDPGARRSERVGLPAWFANLLPEGAMRQYVVRDLGGGRIGDFTLLQRLGADLPGAVVVQGGREPDDDVVPSDAVPDHPLRHSLAGVQLKFSVPGARLTLPVSGQGGWWIVKLPDRSVRELPLNEYLTMRWLAAAGFLVPDTQLLAAKDVGGLPEGLVDPSELVYAVKRFDREAGGRVHVEDFAQVAEVAPAM